MDPTVSINFGGEDDSAEATWFPGSEVHAMAELIEKWFGPPDAREDLSECDGETPTVVASFEDGTAVSWLPGSEVDAISEMLVTRFGNPDSLRG
jgi:hypothetical protein